MLDDSCYLLNYSVLKQLQQFLILAQFLLLCCFQLPFFERPNNCIVSSVNNSSLYPDFISKTILFFILFT